MNAIFADRARAALISLAALALASCSGGGGSGGPVRLGGTVSGLAGSGLVLSVNGGNDLAVVGNGAFLFSTMIPVGTTYSVTVLTQPANPSQTCVVGNGSGQSTGTNVTNVAVACTTNSYAVSGNVSGLAGSAIVLANNGTDTQPISADGTFEFKGPVASGANYSVTIPAQPADPRRHCTVTGGNGTVTVGPVTNVSVVCATVARFAYLLTDSPNGTPGPFGLWGYTIDPTTGGLIAIAGSPVAAGNFPAFVAVAPNSKFLYVASGEGSAPTTGADDVYAYTVDAASGALTAVPGSPYVAGNRPSSVAVDPNSRFVYLANSGSNNVSAYTINSASGALTSVAASPFPAGSDPNSIAVDPSAKFLYVTNHLSSNVSAYAIDAQSGALTPVPGSPFQAGMYPESVTVDLSGKYVYVANDLSGDVSAYAINASTGVLTPIAGSPFPAPTDGGGPFAADPNSNSAYLVSGFLGTAYTFTIDPATGALATTANQTTLNIPEFATFLEVDPSGKFAYVLYRNPAAFSYGIEGYSIDATTGAWTAVPANPVASAGPNLQVLSFTLAK
jgi:6-phosphogluconolactonase